MKSRTLLFFSLLILWALAACSQAADQAPQPEFRLEEPTVEEEAELPRTVAPLSGVPVEKPMEHRIIGVMIDNHSKARPQSGLAQADLVYEVLAEGPITRYLALFHSEIPEVIGPVRSLRPYFLDLARGFDAIIAHAGGSPAAKEEVARTNYPSLDGTGSGGFVFYRTDHRSAPHNLYTGQELLAEGEARFGYNQGYRLPSFHFKAEDEKMSGEAAAALEIVYDQRYYQVGYQYDPATKRYLRYIGGEPHIDAEAGVPLSITNLLVIEANHKILDEQGRREVTLTGKGAGYLFQRGKVHDIVWKAQDGVIRPYVDGEEAALYPGKTWVNIIPSHPGLEQMVTVSGEASF